MRRLRRDFAGIVVVGENEAFTNMENLPGLVIAYGANSAQNAMMACMRPPLEPLFWSLTDD